MLCAWGWFQQGREAKNKRFCNVQKEHCSNIPPLTDNYLKVTHQESRWILLNNVEDVKVDCPPYAVVVIVVVVL